jgi:hypothetical protein
MKVIRAAIVFAMLMLSAGTSMVVQVANACSCQDCDVVRDAPNIVGGWITGWREYGSNQVPHGLKAITTAIEVTEVFKGASPSAIDVLDPASRSTSPDGWFGASGACGKFDQDPTGKYIILGIDRFEHDPALMAGSRIWLVYIGDAREGDAYVQALARLSVLGPPSPPAAGNTPSEPARQPSLAAAGLALIAFSSALFFGSFLRSRHR